MPPCRSSGTSPAPTFEPRVGYCRAIRVGDRILVAGTLGLTAEGAPCGRCPLAQATAALARIVGAIEELGGRASDVVRTRMFAIDPQGDWEAFADAHRVDVRRAPARGDDGRDVGALAVDGCLIEIEAEADLGVRLPGATARERHRGRQHARPPRPADRPRSPRRGDLGRKSPPVQRHEAGAAGARVRRRQHRHPDAGLDHRDHRRRRTALVDHVGTEPGLPAQTRRPGRTGPGRPIAGTARTAHPQRLERQRTAPASG